MFKHWVPTCTAPCNLLLQAEYQWGSKFYQEEIIFFWYHLFWHCNANSWNTTSNSAISNSEGWGKTMFTGAGQSWCLVLFAGAPTAALWKLWDCCKENNVSIQLNWDTDRTTAPCPQHFQAAFCVSALFTKRKVQHYWIWWIEQASQEFFKGKNSQLVSSQWTVARPQNNMSFYISWMLHNESISENWL